MQLICLIADTYKASFNDAKVDVVKKRACGALYSFMHPGKKLETKEPITRQECNFIAESAVPLLLKWITPKELKQGSLASVVGEVEKSPLGEKKSQNKFMLTNDGVVRQIATLTEAEYVWLFDFLCKVMSYTKDIKVVTAAINEETNKLFNELLEIVDVNKVTIDYYNNGNAKQILLKEMFWKLVVFLGVPPDAMLGSFATGHIGDLSKPCILGTILLNPEEIAKLPLDRLSYILQTAKILESVKNKDSVWGNAVEKIYKEAMKLIPVFIRNEEQFDVSGKFLLMVRWCNVVSKGIYEFEFNNPLDVTVSKERTTEKMKQSGVSKPFMSEKIEFYDQNAFNPAESRQIFSLNTLRQTVQREWNSPDIPKDNHGYLDVKGSLLSKPKQSFPPPSISRVEKPSLTRDEKRFVCTLLAEYYGVEVTDIEGIRAVVSKASEFLKVDFFSAYHFESHIKQLLMRTEPPIPGGRW